MFPPIYPIVAASPACVALLKSGNGPIRFYQFGRAEQNVQRPYAVWQRVFGEPQNYLGDVPDMDSFSIQVDVYGGSADSVRTIAVALRDAIEPIAYITSWLGESVDPQTESNRFSFVTEWLVERA